MPSQPMDQRMRNTCDFAASALHFKQICDQYHCDVVLGVHPHRCDLFEKLEVLKERKEGEQNAFVVGENGVRANLNLRATEALELARQLVDMM